MNTCLRMAAVALALVSAALGKLEVSSHRNCKRPGVEFNGAEYLLAWAHSADICAARVSQELTIVQPGEFRVSSDAIPCSLDVASDGDGWLVVWEHPESASEHYIHAKTVSAEGGVNPNLTVIAEGNDAKQAPSAAFCSPPGGDPCYLVVWQDHRNGVPEIWGMRVTPEGGLMDPPGGFPVMQGTSIDCGPRVASDGDQFFVVWSESDGGQPSVWGIVVSADGEPGMEKLILTVSPPYMFMHPPDVTYAAFSEHYLVSCYVAILGICTRACDRTGEPVHLAFEPDVGELVKWRPRTASASVNSCVVWQDNDLGGHRLKSHREHSIEAVGPMEEISPDNDYKYTPDIASDGSYYLIVWADGGDEVDLTGRICCDTLTQWQRRFYSTTSQATAFNQGRNIALDPTTGWIHVVYECRDSVLYTYSTDHGVTWFPYEYIFGKFGGGGPWAPLARYPTIVCENQGSDPVWVSYVELDPRTYETICIGVDARTGPSDWTHFELGSPG